MSSKLTIEAVKENAQIAKKTIKDLKNELNVLSIEYNNLRAQQLREENAKLLLAVEDAKKKLVQLEIKNGVKQYALPTQNSIDVSNKVNIKASEVIVELAQVEVIAENVSDSKQSISKKEKKPKESKAKTAADSDLPIDVGRLDLRIGKIVNVERHPDADTLYVLKINCGEEKPRTVCSGLVKHVPMEELKDRLVVLLCNLKPVKMRGITSEAMVMCASSADVVEVLIPPKDSIPGDIVECDGYTRKPDSIMNPKKKIFETVAPDLHTNDKLEACYKGAPFLVPNKGVILSKSLKNVAVK